MNSFMERNQFFYQNYTLFFDICTTCAKQVRSRFPAIQQCDLMGFAFEGVIHALDRVELEQDTWESYVRRYAYLNTFSGAMNMMGIQRNRSKKIDPRDNPIMFNCAPNEVIEYIENEQKECDWRFQAQVEEYLKNDERAWFMRILGNTVEHRILDCLLHYRSVAEISEICGMSQKKVRGFIDKMAKICNMARNGRAIHHLLTPDTGKKYSFVAHQIKLPLHPHRLPCSERLRGKVYFTYTLYQHLGRCPS